MKNRRILSAAAVALALVSCPAFAEQEEPGQFLGGDLSANVALTSDYRFRGISQTDENPALQGGFDWSRSINECVSAYVGTWASGVDFDDGDEASLEVDLYGGAVVKTGLADVNLGVIYYAYPGADNDLDYDYVEAQVKVSRDFGIAAADVGLNYSPENFGNSGDAFYTQANVSVPLPHGFYAKAHAGYQTIDDEDAFGVDDYADWSLGVGYTWQGFDLSLAYVDTDISKSECDDNCNASAVFTIAKKF